MITSYLNLRQDPSEHARSWLSKRTNAGIKSYLIVPSRSWLSKPVAVVVAAPPRCSSTNDEDHCTDTDTTHDVCTRLFHGGGKAPKCERRKRKERRREAAENLWPTVVGQVLTLDPMQWYCRRPSFLPPILQAFIIIACQYYYSATNLVVAQEAQVENPCLICPDGATAGDDFVPWFGRDPITCKELIDNAKLFETDSLWCAEYEYAGLICCTTTPQNPCTLCPNGITVADDYQPYNDGYTCSDTIYYYATVGWGWGASDIESRCCPTVANNPCTICPNGATAGEDGEDFVLYTYGTCKDIINMTLTFDAESEMCLVYAKVDEYYCCPSSTTEFVDYCNICPDGITAGDDFVPWSSKSVSETCKTLVEDAKIVYENGSVGCNHYKGYELSCCPRAGTVSENTPPPSTSIPDISPPIGTPETATTPSMCTPSNPETAQTSSVATPDIHNVRVQLMGTNYLHMREVQVFDTSGVNRALNKLATQSSSWGVKIRSRMNENKCLVYDLNNHAVFMWDCHGGSNQQWHLPSSKRIEADGNRCLDAPGGAYVHVYWHFCHDGNNQKWTYDDMGRLHSVAYPHLCLDLYFFDNNNGAKVLLTQCNNYMNQQWLFDSTTSDASKAVNGNLTDWSYTLEETGNVP